MDQDFLFNDRLSDIPASSIREPQDIMATLFNKKTIGEALDNIDSHLGISRGGKKTPNVVMRNAILCPAKDADREQLNALFNNPKYAPVLWKDTWTAHGDFRIFVMYQETLDTKPVVRKEQEEETN